LHIAAQIVKQKVKSSFSLLNALSDFYDIDMKTVNYPTLADGACYCPGFVDHDATIGWSTLVANLRGLNAFISSPSGDHATGTDVSCETVHVNRLTLQRVLYVDDHVIRAIIELEHHELRKNTKIFASIPGRLGGGLPAHRDKLPQVDIVIPTFNSAKNIEICLKRLSSQKYEGKTRIIIIDGGSTDSTLDICSRYGCEIHIYKGMYSNGLTGARNKSLEFCNGDLYWQIDSDNFVADDTTLSKLVDPFIEIEDLMIAVPMIDYNPEMSGIDKWLSEYEKFMLLQMAKSGEISGNWSIVKDMAYGITNASLIKTKMIREVGGYDSDVRVLARARKKKVSQRVSWYLTLFITIIQLYHIKII